MDYEIKMIISTKKRVAYALGLGLTSFIYVFTVVILVNGFLSNWTFSDRGIILEIIGFIMFLSPLRDKLSKGIDRTFRDKVYELNEISRILSIIAIGIVIIGLTYQLSMIPDVVTR